MGGGRFPRVGSSLPSRVGARRSLSVQSYFAGWLSPVGGGVCCSRPLVRFPPNPSLARVRDAGSVVVGGSLRRMPKVAPVAQWCR